MAKIGRKEQHAWIKKLAAATFLLGGVLSANAACEPTTTPSDFEFKSVATISDGGDMERTFVV